MFKNKQQSSGKKRRLRHLPMNYMIPNFLTLCALAAGLTSIRFALQDKWEHALIAIAVAAIFDTLDGRVARMLKGASKFGAELDSLSDFVCFGVAPALILYLWTMQDAGPIGWFFVMLFTMCTGLRLARFNVALDDENAPAWKVHFFSGTPAPAGAGLVLLPIILSLNFGEEYFRNSYVVGAFLIIMGGLLVSTVPTFSFKKVRIPPKLVLPTMLIVAGLAAFIASVPWATIAAIVGIYLCSIPFSYLSYRRFENRANVTSVDSNDHNPDQNPPAS